MKFLGSFIALILMLNFLNAANTQTEIKNQEQKLKVQNDEERRINQKIEEFAKDILQTEQNLKQADEKIEFSKKEIITLESVIKSENVSLKDLNLQKERFTRKSDQIEESIINLIMEDFLFTLVTQDSSVSTTSGFVSNEILSSLTSYSQVQIESAVKGYEDILKSIREKTDKIAQIKKNLDEINFKKAQLEKYKAEQTELLKKVQADRRVYINRLSAIKQNQDSIRSALKNLQIIQENEDKEQIKKLAEEKKKAEEKEARLKELKKKEEAKKLESKDRVEMAKLQTDIKESNDKVRIIGSSYQNSRVKKYVGIKTISPLKSYEIKQKFGNYIDPIYGIKIFNETVTLSSKGADSPVYSVFDGKVVFAKEVSMLHKVVIIEHKDQLHTIYANLSQIPANIKVGSVVKKESVIGRVKKDLIFEVTQKNFHINPLEVIK